MKTLQHNDTRTFKEQLANKGPGLKPHLPRVISLLTNKMRMSKVYHVEFPHILKVVEAKTAKFFGGDFI